MSLAHLLDRPHHSEAPATVLRVGDHAPDIELRLGAQRSRLYRWTDESWTVLFTLHDGDALDGTAEMRRLAPLVPDFRSRFIKLLGIAARPLLELGEEPLPFPVSLDNDGEITRRYGLAASARNIAVIDPEHRVRLQLGYPPRRERDFADVLRLITALQQADARERAGRSDWRALQATTFGAW